MKAALIAINAKYIHSGLAVYSLKANSLKYKNNIEIKEFTINHRIEDILREVYFAKPNFIAFSCYIWNIEYVKALVVELVKVLPDVPIWLGGPEASYNAKNLLDKYAMIKGIMVGEGEHSFSKILEHYFDKTIELSDIEGVFYRNHDNGILSNKTAKPMDMNELEFSYSNLDDFQNRVIYYESSRGCPFSCSYCLSSIDKQLRFRGLDKVRNELKFFFDNKVKQVKFIDRTFNCNKTHSLEIWKYLLEADNGVTNFHFEISADLLDEEQIAILSRMRKGLVQFEIGVQTTNKQTMEAIHRTMNFDRIVNAVKQIHIAGNLHQHLDLIAGLPYETFQSFKKSFNDVYSLRPQQLQLGFLKVLHGSKMYDNASNYGVLYQSIAPYEVLATNWISYEEICKLKGIEEVLELYYNSGQFINTIKCLERAFEDPFSLYEALSKFYREKGTFLKHARIHNYTILLEFAETVDKKNEDLYKELLVYDLYLRENVKSRPEFAKNLDYYKTKIKEFYQQEAVDFTYLNEYDTFNAKQIAHMTHMEVFNRNIKLVIEEGVDNQEETFVLFDYRHKDELTHSAKTFIVQM